MSSYLCIAADIVPTQSNYSLFENENVEELIGDNLYHRFQNADYIIMNLEVPLTDQKSPIRKCGPCLSAPTDTIKGLIKINPYFYTLANNHILDQGSAGLDNTIKTLQLYGANYSGVGKNLKEANLPFVTTVCNKKIGIYCCAEHEFSIAGDDSAGANPYDPLESFDTVKSLREKCDYLIVLYHGGKEHYRYPSPLLQKIFHKFADSGADLVIAQHTHCIGCEEKYKGSLLVYGQGNFLFDDSDNDCWKTSLLLCLDLETLAIEYIPLIKKDNTVREASGTIREEILSDFYNRSKQIMQHGFVKSNYSKYSETMLAEYCLRLFGKCKHNMFLRILNKITSYKFIKSLYRESDRIVIENVLDCEAHRELASECMRNK